MMSLFVAAPDVTLAPGVHLNCYGPYHIPTGARSLTRFLPEVNMSIVHHMIMFGGTGTGWSSPKARGPGSVGESPQLCGRGRIIYAWARTGQKNPLPLDFSDSPMKGDGFPVGTGTPTEWIALQVHYQQLHTKPARDSSGVRLAFEDVAPNRPLAVQVRSHARTARAIPSAALTHRSACGTSPSFDLASGAADGQRPAAHSAARPHGRVYDVSRVTRRHRGSVACARTPPVVRHLV